MAGAGYKLFNTGDVLLASEVNTYLQQQVTMVFANATARTSALSGVLAEGMMSYLQDTNTVEVYNGTSWVNVGNAGDITEVQAGTGISVASGTGPIPVVTNSMATEIAAAGDIIIGTGSGTFDNLPIGTTGQILTADTTVSPYKVKWATASAGGGDYTLISRTTFSNVASHIVDNVFTSAYKSYMLIIEDVSSATDSDDLQFQWRVGGSSGSTHTTSYYGMSRQVDYNPTFYNTTSSNASQLTLARNGRNTLALFVNKVGNTNERASIHGTGVDYYYVEVIWCGGVTADTITATGFVLKSSSTNITGAVAVYGMAD